MVLASSICQQSEISDLYIAVRKHMQKEPSDELIGIHSHNFLPVAVSIVTPEESYFAVFNFQDAIIAYSYPVGIPAQILKNSVNAVKRRFAIDNPFLI